MSDPEDDDVLAAEFVLGTLDSDERAEVERRLKTDTALRGAVSDWEDRFSPLLDVCPEISPPSHVLTALMARLIGPAPSSQDDAPTSNILILKRSVQRWRLATAGAMALAAALAGWIVVAPDSDRGGRFVAVLQKDAGSPAIVLDVDVGARRAVVRQVSTDRPAGKSYELWLINPEVGSPRSLGIVQPQGVTKASLAPFDASVIARATYAITVEQPGGSPSGAPSGPPILSGRLVDEGR